MVANIQQFTVHFQLLLPGNIEEGYFLFDDGGEELFAEPCDHALAGQGEQPRPEEGGHRAHQVEQHKYHYSVVQLGWNNKQSSIFYFFLIFKIS